RGQIMSEKKMADERFDDLYLWDGSGEPDAEIVRLEKTLSQFRHKGEAPVFLAAIHLEKAKTTFGFLQLLWPRRFAAVAAMEVAAIETSILILRSAPAVAARPGWEVARIEGAPIVGTTSIQGAGGKGKLEVGQLLVTNGNSRATITVAEIGEIQV